MFFLFLKFYLNFLRKIEEKKMIVILSNILLLLLHFISLNNCAILSVSNPKTLTNALNKALAGDTIQLADGIYSSSVSFKPKNNGTSTKRITLKGSKKAILTAQNLTDALYLNNVNYWVIDGFTVQFSQRGILLDYSTNHILQNLNIGFIYKIQLFVFVVIVQII